MILLPLCKIPSSILIKSLTDRKGFREEGNREHWLGHPEVPM